MTTKLLRRLLCRNVVVGVLAALLAVAPFAGGGSLLSSLDVRPAGALTSNGDIPGQPFGERAADGQGVYGRPGDPDDDDDDDHKAKGCPDGFEVLFEYKQQIWQFKENFNSGISADDRGTVTELVVSAGEKAREVDRSLCVRDVPPCPVSVFQAGRTPPVYMADPADPLFEHRGLDANFVARGQHVVDFGAGFNAAWEAQTIDVDRGYRPVASNVAVADHKPFAEMHPDRCVDAVAEPDPPVVPSDYSECEMLEPEIIDPSTLPNDGGTASFLPYDKDAFVFATTADPAVSMCVRFARRACPPGTLLTGVPQRFKPGTAVDPVYAVEPVGEVEVQRRCRGLVRRAWTCPVGYEPLNQFNRCSSPAPPPEAGRSEAPCLETEGSTAREEAFRGFFGGADCDVYVRGNFAAGPAACSTFGFADPADAGIANADNPYTRVINYLGREHTTVLTEVDAGVEHWCKFRAALLDEACHGSTRLDKLPGCGLNPNSDRYAPGESICLITKSDSGGCVGIVHAIECLAVAAAIGANDEHSDLGRALRDWQDYRQCAPCTDSPFADAEAGCDVSAGNPDFVPVDEQIEDWFKAFVYGRGAQGARILESATIQGALFNLGKENKLRPLGYLAADRPPCPSNKHNRWNLPTSLALHNYISENIVYKWPAWIRSDIWQKKGLQPPTGFQELSLVLDAFFSDPELLARNQRELDEYIEYRDRHYSPNPTEQPAACFDLSSVAAGCRVPFSGSLSHRSSNGTGVALSNMRTDIRVLDVPSLDLGGSVEEQKKRRWKPEQLQNGGPQPVFVSAGPDASKSAARADAGDVECDFAANLPHVELVITEMWPDQQLDYDGDGIIDADGDFIEEFERLFGEDSLDWWGLTCTASEAVSICADRPGETGYRDNVGESCKQNWSVEDCRRRLTALQGLRYLPDLSGNDLHHQDPNHQGTKGDEIKRRNQERVPCTVRDPMDGELDIQCPWQPSRVGYLRIAAVAVWQIKHCLNALGTTDCDITKSGQVRFGKMGAMTVSEPLGVMVYSANSEGRSVALEDNLNLGG